MTFLLRSTRKFALAAGLALIGFAATAKAQFVSGTVTDLLGKGALRDVTVSLLDARDSTLRSTLSGRDGSFRFEVPSPGRYSLSLRGIGFEPMITEPFAVDSGARIVLQFEMARAVAMLDTVTTLDASKFTSVTRGRDRFLQNYRDGRGIFLSGAEILASKRGFAEYVAHLPGFADFHGDKTPDTGPTSCQGLNTELSGQAARMTTTNRSRSSQMNRREDLCALRDEMGRSVYPMDAPCVTTQVDRIGLVKRIEGTTLVVHRSPRLFVPSAEFTFNEAEVVTPVEIVVNFKDVIGVEFYQKPGDVPSTMRIRGSTAEAEVMVSKCAHIQIWTRMAW